MSAADVFSVATIIWKAKGWVLGKAIIPDGAAAAVDDDDSADDLGVFFVVWKMRREV